MKQEKLHQNKRTNVRFIIIWIGLYVALINFLGLASPGLGAALATRLFLSTRRSKKSKREQELLASATPIETRQGGRKVMYYHWNNLGPTVLLVHGWNGRGSQLSQMVPYLLERGYSVLTFDGLGHGNSEGNQSTIFDLAKGVRQAEKIVGPLHGIIAHSMGGPATTLSLTDGLSAKRLVYISPPYSPLGWLDRFIKLARVSPRVGERMKKHFHTTYGERWRILHDLSLIEKMTQPLLVLHDRKDSQVPWTEGKNLATAWPGATFRATHGLGHNRILKDEEVARLAVAFIDQKNSLNLSNPLNSSRGDLYEKTNPKFLETVPGNIVPELQPDPAFV